MIYDWRVRYYGRGKIDEAVVQAPTAADALVVFRVNNGFDIAFALEHLSPGPRGSSGPLVGDVISIDVLPAGAR